MYTGNHLHLYMLLQGSLTELISIVDYLMLLLPGYVTTVYW
jgi:hypothetical protein